MRWSSPRLALSRAPSRTSSLDPFGVSSPALGLSLALGLLLALGSPLARAGSDHDRARAAVQAGQALPLKTLLERLQRDHPGQVLEVELEQAGGRWVYEVKLLQPGGRLLKLELDAATAQVLRSKERSRKPDSRP